MADRRSARRSSGGRLTVNNGVRGSYSTSTRMQQGAARAQRLRRLGNMFAPGGTRDASGLGAVKLSDS